MALDLRPLRRAPLLGTTIVALVVGLAGCTAGAASTTGCQAFQGWESRGFPSDPSSPTNGPRYLTFLATVVDEAPLAADDAEVVLQAAQQIHDTWVAAGGTDGPEGEVARAEARAEQLWTPEVEAASDRVRAYGAETCGVVAP